MKGILPALSLLASSPLGPAVSAAAPTWPQTKAGAILDTPDWSDYRIYPRAALEKDQEGRVLAELLIGEDGKPQECRILTTSFFNELDAGTCALMMRMRFDPARDAGGKAVMSSYVRGFNWRLTDPIRFASGFLRASVVLEDGKMKACEVEEGAAPYLAFWSTLACTFVADVPYYFGSHGSGKGFVEFRLDANDNADFLKRPWPVITPVTSERIVFSINSKGDASGCQALEHRGFGKRGLNNLSVCGRLLSVLWFESTPKDAPPRTGTFESRAFLEGNYR